MPEIFELFGKPVDATLPEDLAQRKSALCPFTSSRCDGGGNRNQTKIALKHDTALAAFFESGLDFVIPGICSISYGSERWVVCPRRLLGFKHDAEGLPVVNTALQPHERKILLEAGLPRNKEIGIWSEVYLKYGSEDTEINYHFDFVATPILRDISFHEIFELYSVTDFSEKNDITIVW